MCGLSTTTEGRTRDFLRWADCRPYNKVQSAQKGEPPPHSLVELNLLRYKRPAWRQDLDRDDPVCRDDREGHDRRVRFKSRTGQLEIGNTLLKLDAYRASLAVAVMVGFMDNIRRGERLESKQKSNAYGSKKPSCPLAHAPESAKPKHGR